MSIKVAPRAPAPPVSQVEEKKQNEPFIERWGGLLPVMAPIVIREAKREGEIFGYSKTDKVFVGMAIGGAIVHDFAALALLPLAAAYIGFKELTDGES